MTYGHTISNSALYRVFDDKLGNGHILIESYRVSGTVIGRGAIIDILLYLYL